VRYKNKIRAPGPTVSPPRCHSGRALALFALLLSLPPEAPAHPVPRGRPRFKSQTILDLGRPPLEWHHADDDAHAIAQAMSAPDRWPRRAPVAAPMRYFARTVVNSPGLKALLRALRWLDRCARHCSKESRNRGLRLTVQDRRSGASPTDPGGRR
jgi:hypothetical protein